MSFRRCSFLVVAVLYLTSKVQGAITQGPMNVTYFPGQPDITLTCAVTNGVPLWIVNGSAFSLTQLDNPATLPGHSRNGGNIVISAPPMNNTMYVCELPLTVNTSFFSDPAFVYVAAAPDAVPDVVVMPNTTKLDGDNVTLTLSWGEPFNNFDPIVNYTVSCSGDVTCPENYTTIDNTTRNYTITNLTSMTNYTFSVVATNSIGSGEAGVVMITTPSLPGNVSGVMLTCEVMDLINQCTVEWDTVTVGNGPLEQRFFYEVYYNGTREEVTNSTALTFTAPPLPDGIFEDNITVTVTANNRFGSGASDTDYDEIMSFSVTDAVIMITADAMNTTYNFTATCTIHPDSTANVCEVMGRPDNATTHMDLVSATAPTNNRMATVTVNLTCGVNYGIVAGGTLNGELVGLRLFVRDFMRPCPVLSPTTTIASSTSMTATQTAMVTPTSPTPVVPPDIGGSSDNSGAAIGGGVGGGIAVAVIIIIIIIVVVCCIKKREKSSRPTSPGDRVGFRPASGVKVQTLDRYGKPVVDGDNTDTGVELTVTSSGQPTTFQSNEYQTVQSDEKNRTPSAFVPEGSYDTLAPADEPPAPSAQVIPPAQNGQSNPNAPKLNYAELEQFTRKPASVKKPEPQPSSQYAVIDPKSLQGTYT